MVDPVSLTLGGIAAALVVKAAEKAGESAVDTGSRLMGRLISMLKDRFSSTDDERGLAALQRAQDPPVGADHVARLAEVIDFHAEDPDCASALRELVEEIESAGGVDVSGAVQQVYGDRNVLIADVTGSSINLSQSGGD